MLESLVEDYLVRRVDLAGGETRKVKWIGRKSAPDRRVMLPTICCWVELKSPKGKLRDDQLREHKRMQKYGELVFVIRSINDVDEFMRLHA